MPSMDMFAKLISKKSRNTLESPLTEVPVEVAERRLYVKCPSCHRIVDVEDMATNLDVCPRCGHHMRLTARRRIEITTDADSFVEWDADLRSRDFLNFPGYASKLEKYREKSGENDAVVCGRATIDGLPCALFVMSGDFMMGSMGSVVGEKIARCFEKAGEAGLPVVGFTVSGGARMQEGTTSLMQMAKVSAAQRRFSDAGGLYVCVLTDPTSGGVTASFAMLGDVTLAEPGALVAFAGPRVIEQTIHRKLPAGFQSAEFQLEHGFVDQIVARPQLKGYLGRVLALHGVGADGAHVQPAAPGVDTALGIAGRSADAETSAEHAGGAHGERPSASEVAQAVASTVAEAAQGVAARVADGAQAVLQEAHRVNAARTGAPAEEGGAPEPASAGATSEPGEATQGAGATTTPAPEAAPASAPTAYDRVRNARSTHRPTALTLISQVFDEFVEFHGDRRFADDGAVVGGIARLGGQAVTVIGTERGTSTKDRVARNFGSAHPEGYRKALRLMQQAEKFGRPVICLIDTSGAYCGIEAEERGQGLAIAENLAAMAGLTVPLISVVIGEGGSGGALGLGMGNEVWMLENAVYSVISPEGCASILYKDAAKAAQAAEQLGLTADDLLRLGIIDRIVSEHDGNVSALADELRAGFEQTLATLGMLSGDELVAQRYERFRKIGVMEQ